MNIIQEEINKTDYSNMYYNVENGDIYLHTKYFLKQNNYTELIKHIIQVTK